MTSQITKVIGKGLPAKRTSLDIDVSSVTLPKTEEATALEANETIRPTKKRFTTAKDRRNHLKKNFASRVGHKEEYRPKFYDLPKEEEADQLHPKEPRKPKKKVAALVGFCGTGYQGMQINPGAKTIEEDLFKAFVAAGAISKANSDNPRKVSLMRAARTDKGVHAAGNVVSLKMIIDIPDLVQKINENLPVQIRMWGYARVVKAFHAKTLCDSRVYEYLVPTYVFTHQPPPNPLPAVTSIEHPSILENETLRATSTIRHISYEDIPVATTEEMIKKRRYRIPEETLKLVRQGFKEYEGTHNYHNFTLGRSPTDRSCDRYITKFEVSNPMAIQNTEWLSLKVHGQSFMLHQIRKMVSLIVLIVRSGTSLSLIQKTFTHVKINIPKAPALGLLLEQPVFNSYNKKAIEKGKDLVDFEAYRERIDEFKEKYIYSKIYAQEFEENTFQNWLNVIDYHTARDYGYLNSEGIIPQSAIVKYGAKIYKGRPIDDNGTDSKNEDEDESDESD